jgi:peroxiredoxin
MRSSFSVGVSGWAACVLAVWASGCSPAPAPSPAGDPNAAMSGSYEAYTDADIKFLDETASQEAPSAELLTIPVTTADGKATTLKELSGGKRLVVVFTRGFAGSICPYCSTQTARLIANYPEFTKRNTEVVVIYPLKDDTDRPRLDDFLKKANANNAAAAEQVPPFPLVVDIGLKAVDSLELRKDLSKAATYIVEPDGAIGFAYVGKSLADRPSVKALLAQLDGSKPAATNAGSPAPAGGSQ